MLGISVSDYSATISTHTHTKAILVLLRFLISKQQSIWRVPRLDVSVTLQNPRRPGQSLTVWVPQGGSVFCAFGRTLSAIIVVLEQTIEDQMYQYFKKTITIFLTGLVSGLLQCNGVLNQQPAASHELHVQACSWRAWRTQINSLDVGQKI